MKTGFLGNQNKISEFILSLINNYQPGHERFHPELEANVLNVRFDAESILDDSSSLMEYLQEKFEQTYQEARELILIQLDLAADTVPEMSWFTLSQGLDEDWFSLRMEDRRQA